MEVEKNLGNIPNLNYAVIRPAITYGTGDCTGLSTQKLARINS